MKKNYLKSFCASCVMVLVAMLCSSGGPIGYCPEENRTETVYLADYDDCAAFYVCDWGNPVYHRCDPGLFFNAVTNTCDWPENVDCSRSGGSNGSAGGNNGSGSGAGGGNGNGNGNGGSTVNLYQGYGDCYKPGSMFPIRDFKCQTINTNILCYRVCNQ